MKKIIKPVTVYDCTLSNCVHLTSSDAEDCVFRQIWELRKELSAISFLQDFVGSRVPVKVLAENKNVTRAMLYRRIKEGARRVRDSAHLEKNFPSMTLKRVAFRAAMLSKAARVRVDAIYKELDRLNEL